MTHSPVLLALDALACFRLTRLVTTDTLTEPLRRLAAGHHLSSDRTLDGQKIPMASRPGLIGFLTCPWCVSFYLAIGVVLMQSLLASAWFYASVVLALSALAGLLSESR